MEAGPLNGAAAIVLEPRTFFPESLARPRSLKLTIPKFAIDGSSLLPPLQFGIGIEAGQDFSMVERMNLLRSLCVA
jgi:hypothetical protein